MRSVKNIGRFENSLVFLRKKHRLRQKPAIRRADDVHRNFRADVSAALSCSQGK